jgi:hypothetical protein
MRKRGPERELIAQLSSAAHGLDWARSSRFWGDDRGLCFDDRILIRGCDQAEALAEKLNALCAEAFASAARKCEAELRACVEALQHKLREDPSPGPNGGDGAEPPPAALVSAQEGRSALGATGAAA